MRTKRLMAALCAMIICISLILCGCTYEDNNSTYADGKRTDRYVVQYLEITVPETYIKLTSSLRDSDQRWADANISDPSQRKDDYKNRGIRFNKET